MDKRLITREETLEVLNKLDEAYPDAGCALDYDNVYHLLISVVLSAQTTDVAVNKVTPALFERYPEPKDLAAAELPDVEEYIRKIGLYKNKAKNIVALSKMIVDKYDGEVPGNFNELVKLPGVGRKTANVLLAEAFGEQRIAVDTHVFRVSNRIGLADSGDVLETENDLMNILPDDKWTRAHHLLIFHGRRCCSAKKPDCQNCPIGHICLELNSKQMIN
ncbi:MAG: endonuclease III [Clostridiales bacterium]|nr:endonuclease III [Candidatus Crickella merdequi]